MNAAENWKLQHPSATIERVIAPAATPFTLVIVYRERGAVKHARVNTVTGRAA